MIRLWAQADFIPGALALVALVAYACAVLTGLFENAEEMWAAPLATLLFALVQVCGKSCRPRLRTPLCPFNWALLAFFVQLVVLPLDVCLAGATAGALPHVPAARWINSALLVNCAAFLAFALGCVVSRPASRGRPRAPTYVVGHIAIVLYLAAGGLGMFLVFGVGSQFFLSITDPDYMTQVITEQQGTVQGAAGLLLRPFLMVAFVMMWARWADSAARAQGQAKRFLVTAAAIVGVVLVGASFSFNRSSFFVPVIALVASYSLHVKRLSRRAYALGVIVAVALALTVRVYRGGILEKSDLNGLAAVSVLNDRLNLRTEFQVYGQAPQYLGFLLEGWESNPNDWNPGTLFASMLYSVPVLGKPYREHSGATLYNRMIYGSAGFADQIIPFEGEVRVTLGWAGLIVAFVVLGVVVSALQIRFEQSASSLFAYMSQYTAMWLTFLLQGSVAAVCQIFVYFFWPLYLFLAFLAVQAAMRKHSGARAPPAVASRGHWVR